MMNRILISTVVMIFSGAVRAKGLDLNALARIIPESLVANGIDQAEEINLAELVKELSKVQFLINSNGTYLAGSGETRTGGIYTVENRTVIINQQTLGLTSKAELPLYLLHEGLGAAGYIDEDYQITLSLFLLLNRSLGNLNFGEGVVKPFLTNIKRRMKEPVYRKSGKGNSRILLAGSEGTSVGGGGDPFALALKLRTVLVAVARLKVEEENLFIHIMKTPFETLGSMNVSGESYVIRAEDGRHVVRLVNHKWFSTRLLADGANVQMKIAAAVFEDLVKVLGK